MAITTVDVQELSTRFAEVFSLASSGSEVLITENHIPVARLVPLTPGQARNPRSARRSKQHFQRL